MIVEIQGVDEERMKKIEEIILPRLGLVNITKAQGFDRKIRLSADTGEAKLVNTHLNVWGAKGVGVYLREPGKLGVTIEGSYSLVSRIIVAFLNFDIVYAEHAGEFVDLLAKEL